MNIIVSTELQDNQFAQFTVMSSFKDVKDLIAHESGGDKEKGKAYKLIIHKPMEDEFKVGIFIADLCAMGVKSPIYINSTPSTMITMAVNGINGFCFTDDFYLDDEDELLDLLSQLEHNENSLVAVSLNIIEDYFGSLMRNEVSVRNSVYLDQVQQALMVLNDTVEKQQLQIMDMGTTTVKIFSKASTMIRNLADNAKRLEQVLNESRVLPQSASTPAAMSNTITLYQPFTYSGNATAIVIKEYTPCRYLTTFLLGYHHHLKFELNKKVKLIFLHAKGFCLMKMYDGIATILSEEGLSNTSLYDAEVIATSVPKRDIMKRLTSGKDDVIIVVDRLYQSTPMLSGRVKMQLNAIGGVGDLNKYKVKAEDSILSVVGIKNSFISLPTITNFPMEVDARRAQIIQVNGDNFKKLDVRSGLV